MGLSIRVSMPNIVEDNSRALLRFVMGFVEKVIDLTAAVLALTELGAPLATLVFTSVKLKMMELWLDLNGLQAAVGGSGQGPAGGGGGGDPGPQGGGDRNPRGGEGRVRSPRGGEDGGRSPRGGGGGVRSPQGGDDGVRSPPMLNGGDRSPVHVMLGDRDASGELPDDERSDTLSKHCLTSSVPEVSARKIDEVTWLFMKKLETLNQHQGRQ